MLEAGYLEIDQHMALQDTMVEDQVDETVRIADEDAFLARLEAETVAEFDQECLQLVELRVFEMRLSHRFLRTEAQELEHVGVSNAELGLGGFGACLHQRREFFGVLRRS